MGYQHTEQKLDLSTIPLFEDMNAELLEMITIDMVHFYKDGQMIIQQGEEPDSLIVLLHGNACVYRDDIYIATRRSGETIGEQAFIDQTIRSATVKAQGMVEALVLNRSHVMCLMENTTFVQNLLRIVSNKLREATNERAYHLQHEQLLFGEFRAHLSPEVTNKLLSTGQNYGRPRFINAVILFADIRSFTMLSASLSAKDIAIQLSRYFDAIVGVIHNHEGLVDKFIGDAVLAVWGFSSDSVDLADKALACAEEMLSVAKGLRFADEPIEIGIGLNAGGVFIGNVGGDEKRQFTVLGTPVNLAARYQSETKTLGQPIVVGIVDRTPR